MTRNWYSDQRRMAMRTPPTRSSQFILPKSERDLLSLLQRNRVQFFHCGAVFPQVINGRCCGGEGKVVERCGAKGLQKVDGADPNADVRDVMISAVIGNED